MASKKAKADEADDLLETKAKGKGKGKGKAAPPAKKKAAAKAAAPTKKGKGKAAAEPEEDDDEVLAPKKAKKGDKAAKGKKANGKAAAAEPRSRGRGSDRPLVAAEDVRKALLKVKKPISYSDFADANEFNLRQVRRTARRLRDSGELSIEHSGTEGMVQRVA